MLDTIHIPRHTASNPTILALLIRQEIAR